MAQTDGQHQEAIDTGTASARLPEHFWVQVLCLAGAVFYVGYGLLFERLGFEDPSLARFLVGGGFVGLAVAAAVVSASVFRLLLVGQTLIMSLHAAFLLHTNQYQAEAYMGCFLLMAAVVVTFVQPMHVVLYGLGTLVIFGVGFLAKGSLTTADQLFLMGLIMLQILGFFSLNSRWHISRKLAEANQRLQARAEQLQFEVESSPLGLAFDSSPMGIVLDDDGTLVLANPAFCSAMRYPLEELRTLRLESLEVAGSRVEFPNRTHEVTFLRKDGSRFSALVHGMQIASADGKTRSLSFVEDITERKQNEQAIVFSAYHDPLTGLINRTKLRQVLEAALAEAVAQEQGVAVMFLDLDNFKQVNDSLGHGVGDSLLQQVAVRVSGIVYPRGTVARLGGDEFTVVLPDASLEVAEAFAHQIITELARPYDLSPHEVRITASIGIAMAPDHGADPSGLMKAADLSLYEAKHKGKNRSAVYAATMHQVIMVRHAIENALHKAVQREELEVYYQPQVDLATGKLLGAEALLRWNHPERGLVFPGEFIPIAEETGLILPISQQVIRTVCIALRDWGAMGIEPPRIALNLSARQIQTNHIVDSLKWELQATGVSPRHITVELTESTMVASRDRAIEVIRTLREMGVQTAVDDFGTGYSSLSYLKDFPLDVLKIDRSFVNDMQSTETLGIVRALLDLASTLNMQTVAEGIETEAQRRQLLDMGVRKAQGYLFSKAVPFSAFTEMLATGASLGAPIV